MAKTKGPGPVDPTQGGRLLDLRAKIEQLKEAKKAKEAAEVGGVPGASDATRPEDVHPDGFSPRSSGVSFEPPSEADRGGHLKARLQALGVKGAGLIKSHQTEQVRATTTPLGKVLEGIVRADSPQAMQRLQGVVKAHEIGLQESRIKSADLLVLQSLIEVGRFTIEGSPTLQTTDALGSLETAGSVYIGFNDALSRVQLNLKRVDVLIIEGNPALREIVLPKLEVVTRYLHIHDNAALAKVQLGSKDRPVKCASFELVGNAHTSYPSIFLA